MYRATSRFRPRSPYLLSAAACPPPRPPLFPYTTLFRSSDRLAIDRHACGGELASDPWGSVDLVGGMERVAHGLIDLGPALGSRARARLSLLAPGVVALACHAQQPGHAGDLVVRLLRVHQLEPFRPGGFDAKKAAAFPRNSLSLSRS